MASKIFKFVWTSCLSISRWFTVSYKITHNAVLPVKFDHGTSEIYVASNLPRKGEAETQNYTNFVRLCLLLILWAAKLI